MNKELLRQEQERITNLLSGTDPSTEAYTILLHNLDRLWWMISDGKFDYELKTVNDIKPDEVIIEPTPLAEPVSTPVVEEKKIIDDKLLAYDEVREICNKAMSRGVNVKEIIAKYVPAGEKAKLTLIPQERYAELVEEVSNAE